MTVITAEYPEHLRRVLERRAPATAAAVDVRHAAVAVTVTREPEPALLFVQRQERPSDPWSGHVAFPGGFRSAGESAIATAERETEEETGLPLARVGRPLGVLDDVLPRSIYLPRVAVTPVVFAVEGRPPVSPLSEVSQAVWVPASAVFAPANRRPLELSLPMGRQSFDAIVVQGLTIWGLTERIVSQLATL